MKLPKDFGRINMEEEMLRQDAKRRMKAWRKEDDEGDGIIMFVIIVAVAILIGDFVIRLIY